MLEREPETGVPTAGGVLDVVHRDWIDAEVGAGGDIPEAEWLAGTRAADKRFEFGAIAPGCTARDEAGIVRGQGFPSTRITEVCQGLDVFEDWDGDGVEEKETRCCIESICANDFTQAFDCFTTAIRNAVISCPFDEDGTLPGQARCQLFPY